MLPQIKKANTLYIDRLSNFPSYFIKQDREHKIKEIIQFVNPQKNEEIVIESNDIKYSYWAEIVAARIKCKHFLYTLEAFFPYRHTNMEYLLFKLKRKELAGTRESSLYNLLGADTINKANNQYFVIRSTNIPVDIPPPVEIVWDKYDFRICYLGRETKPFFRNASDDILSFTKKHPEKKILYLCLGCTRDNPYCRELEHNCDNIANVSLVFTGRLFPLLRTYFDHIDLLIGSSGCASLGGRVGVKTIKYLDNGTTPLGVIGYDIKDRRSEQKVYPGNLTQLLQDIYFNHFLKKFQFDNLYTDDPEVASEISAGSETIISPNERAYYDTTKIREIGIKGMIYKIIKARSIQQRLVHVGLIRKD